MGDWDVLEWTSPGAAGFGDPLARDTALVLEDVRAQMISPDDARRVYGVVLDDESLTVDTVSTENERRQRRRERLEGREPLDLVTPPKGARGIGDLLYLVDGRWWCNGLDLGPISASYKDAATMRDTRVRDLGPEYHSSDTEMADRFMLREYFCPRTGYRLDAELLRVDGEPLEEISLR
jgi:hypothetical protein